MRELHYCFKLCDSCTDLVCAEFVRKCVYMERYIVMVSVFFQVVQDSIN